MDNVYKDDAEFIWTKDLFYVALLLLSAVSVEGGTICWTGDFSYVRRK